MPARITAVRDAAAARIKAAWADAPVAEPPYGLGAPPLVLTPAVVEVEPDTVRQLTVFVIRDGYSDGGPVTRAKDATLYRIRVVVIDPYKVRAAPTDPYSPRSSPTDAWLEARLAFVEAAVWGALTNARRPLELADPPALAYPQAAEVVAAYDPDALLEKLFVSDIEITYRVVEE